MAPVEAECGLCTETLWQPVTLPCGETFCQQCLRQWTITKLDEAFWSQRFFLALGRCKVLGLGVPFPEESGLLLGIPPVVCIGGGCGLGLVELDISPGVKRVPSKTTPRPFLERVFFAEHLRFQPRQGMERPRCPCGCGRKLDYRLPSSLA